jgi:hypothetical protein
MPAGRSVTEARGIHPAGTAVLAVGSAGSASSYSSGSFARWSKLAGESADRSAAVPGGSRPAAPSFISCMKMVLQLAVQDIGQLTYLEPPCGPGHHATAEPHVTPCIASPTRIRLAQVSPAQPGDLAQGARVSPRFWPRGGPNRAGTLLRCPACHLPVAWVRLFRSEVRGQGLFRRSRAAGTPARRAAGRQLYASPASPAAPVSPVTSPGPVPGRCRAGATTTMEHCRGHNHHDAPSSWSAGLPPNAGTRSGASRAPPAPQPDTHFGRATPMPHRAGRGESGTAAFRGA